MTSAAICNSCPEIDIALSHITAMSEPASVFLYGSRARGDATSSSDFEFAAVYERSTLVSRSQLVVPTEVLDGVQNRIAIYPFVLSDLVLGRIETPFPAAIFLNELHDTAVGLLGLPPKDIVTPQTVHVADSIADCFLAAGRTLSGLDSARDGHLDAGCRQVRKARYTALRTGILLRDGNLLHHTHDLEQARETLLDDHPLLSDFETSDDADLTQRALYEAISVLTQELLPELQSRPASDVLLKAEVRR